MDEEQLIYEEEEVVWAKIRGYPWWPAFVSELHQMPSNDVEYTVVFFGDNTNSRLDGSKLRKFVENYIECYSKAKTHRKLMMSIMMAEDKLRQNDQNTQIFEQFRNRVKNKRGKPPSKEPAESSEHLSEQGSFKNKKKPNENQIYQQPEEEEKQPPKKQQKSKDKNVQEKPKQVKRGRKKIEVNQQSIEEQAESEMKQQKEEVDIQKIKKQKKQKHQIYMKKAAVNTRTYDISIQVKNGEIIQRKLSQNVIKEEQHKFKEKKELEVKEESAVKKEQAHQMVDEKDQQEVKEVKGGKGRKKSRQRTVPQIIALDTPIFQQVNQQSNKNKTVSEVKENKKSKQIPLPTLQKHPTQPLPVKQQYYVQEQASQLMINQDSQSLSSQFVKVKRRGRSVSTGQNLNGISRPIVFPRKRGRPKKIDVARPIDEDNDSQKEDKNENIPNFKKKPIQKQPVSKEIQKPKEKSLADQAIINGVKKLLHNRKGLIEFLSQSTINVDNIKEILDMDVSNILQQGVVTEHVMHLLQLFRAALLYKYFPDDVKHRKKYEKLVKKKNHDPEREEMQEKVQEMPEIRKKTISKLKKFLSSSNEQQSKIVQVAQKIEQLIYEKDEDVGNQYCKVAFQVLSSLKQKKQKYQDLIQKLQSKFYD